MRGFPALIVALLELAGEAAQWRMHYYSISNRSRTGFDPPLKDKPLRAKELLSPVDILSHGKFARGRERGACTRYLWAGVAPHQHVLACRLSTVVRHKRRISLFIEDAYRTEKAVTFTYGDPVRYESCWVVWYGIVGFIVQCNIKGGYLYIPWNLCPLNIKYV